MKSWRTWESLGGVITFPYVRVKINRKLTENLRKTYGKLTENLENIRKSYGKLTGSVLEAPNGQLGRASATEIAASPFPWLKVLTHFANKLAAAMNAETLSPLELEQLEAGVESSTAQKSELRALCREKCRGGPRLRTLGRRAAAVFPGCGVGRDGWGCT